MKTAQPGQQAEQPQYTPREKARFEAGKRIGFRRGVAVTGIGSLLLAGFAYFVVDRVEAANAKLTPACVLTVREGETGWGISTAIDRAMGPSGQQPDEVLAIENDLERTGTNPDTIIDNRTNAAELPSAYCHLAGTAFPGAVSYLPGASAPQR